MATYEIPVQQSTPNYRVRTSLPSPGASDVAYLIDFRWNVRDLAWFMDVYDVNEIPIRTGIKVVVGTYIGRASTLAPFKDGVFLASDTSGATLDAGFDDFGTRVRLSYIQSFDLLTMFSQIGVKL